MLKRQELSYLEDWSERTGRKPLIIRGARQVGKSTLVRQLADKKDFSLREVNFERNPEFRDIFSSKDPVEILSRLQLLTGTKIQAGKSLLFLDEIQAAPEALAALRYFYEEMPQLHVIAAGSLLEFTLAEFTFSMPVGRIEYMYLGPMQFEDFLHALGETVLVENLQKLSIQDIHKKELHPLVHQKYISLLKQYFIVGGLPEAIAQYAKTRDYDDVSRIQKNIVAIYRDDFNKYSHGSSRDLVQLLFDHLPTMVGKKFKYSQISRDYRTADLEKALQKLCMARIATKVFHSSANGIPLAAEKNPRYFKTIFLDVGLMSAALNLNVLDLHKEDLSLINNGAVAEQFAGQHLLYGGEYYESPELFYWVREARSAAAEIDYLISKGQQIIPVEIKAGRTGTLKSLHQFLKEKNRSFAIRLNGDVPSLMRDKKKLTAGIEVEYDLLSLPLYMVGQIRRLIVKMDGFFEKNR